MWLRYSCKQCTDAYPNSRTTPKTHTRSRSYTRSLTSTQVKGLFVQLSVIKTHSSLFARHTAGRYAKPSVWVCLRNHVRGGGVSGCGGAGSARRVPNAQPQLRTRHPGRLLPGWWLPLCLLYVRTPGKHQKWGRWVCTSLGLSALMCLRWFWQSSEGGWMSFIWWDRGERRSQGASRTGEFMTAHEQNKLMHKSRHTPLHAVLICDLFLSPRFVPPKPASLARMCYVSEHILPMFSPVWLRIPQVH